MSTDRGEQHQGERRMKNDEEEWLAHAEGTTALRQTGEDLVLNGRTDSPILCEQKSSLCKHAVQKQAREAQVQEGQPHAPKGS